MGAVIDRVMMGIMVAAAVYGALAGETAIATVGAGWAGFWLVWAIQDTVKP